MIVLHSRDLVNWSIVGHVVPNVTSLDPELNWNRMGRMGQMGRMGRGIWAGSIRFHGGRFFRLFRNAGSRHLHGLGRRSGRAVDCAEAPAARSRMGRCWGDDGVGRFSFSTDGLAFTVIGLPCKAGWAAYRGDRIGIYTTGPAGFVDVDSFVYTVEKTAPTIGNPVNNYSRHGR